MSATKLTLQYLRENSGLPGPRGNLELLHRFLREADEKLIADCLAVIREDTRNSPEEFLGMCGVAGQALQCAAKPQALAAHLRKYAGHGSWRIREAVAIAIQELPCPTLEDRLAVTARLECDDDFTHRAIVAGLCEPRNLTSGGGMAGVFAHLRRATDRLAHDNKLTAAQDALRKALGYGWSVAVAAAPTTGRAEFETLLRLPGKHVRWIVAENLKKARLVKAGGEWVEKLRRRTVAAT